MELRLTYDLRTPLWARFTRDARDDRRHDLLDGIGFRRGGAPSANSRCPAPISVGASVSMSASAAMRPELALGGEVAGDHGCGFGEERDAAAAWSRAAGRGAHAGGDEPDDRHRDRLEQVLKARGQVAGDGAGPGASRAGRRHWRLEPGYPVADQLGEEGVEVGEVPVQDALGAARPRW